MESIRRLIPGSHYSQKTNAILIVLVLAALIGLSSAGYFYYQLGTTKGFFWSKNSPAAAQKREQEVVAKLVSEVGKLMELPSNETPTVATVTDVNKLKAEAFFQNAKNGDKVLIYQNAKKVILYNPVAKKIVNVGPFSTGGNQATPSAQAKIAIRNGTQTPAMAAKVEGILKKTFPEAAVVSKENAASSNFEKTLVIVLNNALKDIAGGLSKSLGAQVVDLPSGESKPQGADILIIVGKDKI